MNSNTHHRRWLVALTTFVLLWLPGWAASAAQPGLDHDAVLVIAQSGAGVSPAEAAAMARARHGGEVLSVVRVKSNGGGYYRVKILLPGGRVKVVRVQTSPGDG